MAKRVIKGKTVGVLARAQGPLLPVLSGGAGWLCLTAFVVVLLDQLAKFLVRAFLPLGSSVDLLPFFSISHTRNVGIAFGLLQFEVLRWFLVAVAVGVSIVILFSCKHARIRSHFVAWGLIFGGALGNAVDRVLFGAVTDFVDFHFWPAFNVADSALSVGVLLLVLHSLRDKE